MKHIKSIAVFASAALLFTACRKEDVLSEQPISNVENAPATGEAWAAAGNWTSVKAKSSTVNYFVIEDSKLTNRDGGQPLVIVYRKKGGAVNNLPFEENNAGNNVYWFYQINGNKITINKQGTNLDAQGNSQESFMHVVITGAQLNSLSDAGYSPDQLMALSPEKLKTLIK